jgi:tetratricopeptide (TPR) repeat protein
MFSQQAILIFLLVVSVASGGCVNCADESTDPKDAQGFVAQGHERLAAAEFDKALSDFTDAIRLDPKFTPAFEGRGIAWGKKGELDKAIKDFDEAIRLNPTRETAFYGRGITWQNKRDFAKAVEDYTQAIKLNPKYTAAFANRASVWSYVGEWDKATDDYTEAIRLNPNLAVAFAQRGVIWQFKKEYAKALDDFTEAIRLGPDSHAPHCSRAWLRATCADGKYRDGKKAVEDAMRACDLVGWKDAACLVTLAAACAENEQFDEAVKWQKKALEDAEFAKHNDEFARKALKLYESKKPYHEDR